MFGFTEEQITGFGLSFGLGAFMLYMLFIVGQLAWEAKAGRFGTFVIFIVDDTVPEPSFLAEHTRVHRASDDDPALPKPLRPSS